VLKKEIHRHAGWQLNQKRYNETESYDEMNVQINMNFTQINWKNIAMFVYASINLSRFFLSFFFLP